MLSGIIYTIRIVSAIVFLAAVIITRVVDIDKAQSFFKRHRLLAFGFGTLAVIGGISFILTLCGI